MIDVRENCLRILERIREAAARSSRDASSIKLIAVTKTVAPARIREAFNCGIRDIGENRLQEAAGKVSELADLPLTWHFIGHLQTNKAKKVIEHFQCVQCVDRPELARKLNEAATAAFPVLIEVKMHDEPTKSGVSESALPDLIARLHECEKLELRGLMAIPPFLENAEDVRPYFRRLRELGTRLGLPELSMGMSHDFEVAIEEGATMVRIGSAIFGGRG